MIDKSKKTAAAKSPAKDTLIDCPACDKSFTPTAFGDEKQHPCMEGRDE